MAAVAMADVEGGGVTAQGLVACAPAILPFSRCAAFPEYGRHLRRVTISRAMSGLAFFCSRDRNKGLIPNA